MFKRLTIYLTFINRSRTIFSNTYRWRRNYYPYFNSWGITDGINTILFLGKLYSIELT